MMSSVTSTVMSYDVIMYIHQPHTITEAAGLPTFTFCSSSITERKKDEKMTSTQLECLYTDQHSTRVLTQQTSKHLATVLTQKSLPNEVLLCIPVFIYSNYRVGTEYAWSEWNEKTFVE